MVPTSLFSFFSLSPLEKINAHVHVPIPIPSKKHPPTSPPIVLKCVYLNALLNFSAASAVHKTQTT
jgi:hypothetical protein